MSEYHDLLLEAYRGELFGETYFKTPAETSIAPVLEHLATAP